MTWTTEAKCRGLDTDLFFEPEREDFPDRDSWLKAKRAKLAAVRPFCKSCPVAFDCLQENLNTPNGIFGGLSADQRVALAKKKGMYIPKDALRYEQTPMTEDRVQLVQGYWAKGHSISDIEDLTGINRGSISRIVYTPEFIEAAASGTKTYRFQKNWCDDKYADVRLLITQGLNAKEIWRRTNIHWKTVRRIKYSMELVKEQETANAV